MEYFALGETGIQELPLSWKCENEWCLPARPFRGLAGAQILYSSTVAKANGWQVRVSIGWSRVQM